MTKEDINDNKKDGSFTMKINLDQSCEDCNPEFEQLRKFLTATNEKELYEASKGNEILEEAYEECIRFMNLDYVQEYARKQQRLEK